MSLIFKSFFCKHYKCNLLHGSTYFVVVESSRFTMFQQVFHMFGIFFFGFWMIGEQSNLVASSVLNFFFQF